MKIKKISKILFISLLVVIAVYYQLFIANNPGEATAYQIDNFFNNQDLKSNFVSPGELVICSQNLANYGEYDDVKKRVRRISYPDFKAKEESLIKRFITAKCDVIAVQEILSSSKKGGTKVLARMAAILNSASKRNFKIVVGDSNDAFIRSGFLIDINKARLITTRSFYRTELPKLSKGQKQRYFSRGPVEVQLAVGGIDSVKKNIALFNFHFKSRSSLGGRDPSGYDFELVRMEMAEALRNIAEKEAENKDLIVVLLGDRNDDYNTASAKIIEGELTLDHFRHGGACYISKRGLPLCEGEKRGERIFRSVLVHDPQLENVEGTLRYRNNYYWLDDILLSNNSLQYALTKAKRAGDYNSGVVSYPQNASDHSLVWVKLNWQNPKPEKSGNNIINTNN